MTKGKIVVGKIEKVMPTYLIASIEGNYEGILHIGNISDFYISNINHLFKVGDKYEFLVIEIDENKKRLQLSWKAIVPRFLKDPFDYQIEETEKGFKSLKKLVSEDLRND